MKRKWKTYIRGVACDVIETDQAIQIVPPCGPFLPVTAVWKHPITEEQRNNLMAHLRTRATAEWVNLERHAGSLYGSKHIV